MAKANSAPAKSAPANAGAPAAKKAARVKKNMIPLGSGSIAVYATPKISTAMKEITDDMNLYHGVRLLQVLEAVYTQGKKDGARTAIGELHKAVKVIEKAVPHRNPGKPKK